MGGAPGRGSLTTIGIFRCEDVRWTYRVPESTLPSDLANLAAIRQERSDHAKARRLRRGILEECPGDVEAIARV